MSDWTVRPITDDELAAWRSVPYRNFHIREVPSDSDLDWLKRRYASQNLTAAVEDDRIIGTFRTWDIDLPVPGATVRGEAVSSVAVLPTHRRRGVLTDLMAAGLDDARGRGCAVSILIASGGEIYERFGYGVATEHCTWTLDAVAPTFREDYTAGFDFELCLDADLTDLAPSVYERAAPGMPGAMPRDEFVWAQMLGTSGLSHEDSTKSRPAVVVRRAGEPVGYARYHVKEVTEQRVDRSVLELDDLAAVTPEANASLWQFLASIDLVATVRAGDRPVHEPLPWLLRDRRAARQSERADFQWVCMLDVRAALEARTYDAAGHCVLEVPDAATVLLETDGTESTVVATSRQPDVTLPGHALGSAYLGQVAIGELHAAGLVTEHTTGAVRRLEAMLRHTPGSAVGHTWF